MVTAARHTSGRRVLGLGLAVAVLIPLASAALDLYDRAWHWGKVVHASEALILTLLVGLLWLGYRDRFDLEMPTRLVVAAAIATGVALGVIKKFGRLPRAERAARADHPGQTAGPDKRSPPGAWLQPPACPTGRGRA